MDFFLQNERLNHSYPIGGIFSDIDYYCQNPNNPSAFFSLEPLGLDKKPAGNYLVGYTRGNYGKTSGIAERFIAYAEENGLAFDGPVYNVFLLSDLCVSDGELLMQASVQVKPARKKAGRR
jgi:hypothetical protein